MPLVIQDRAIISSRDHSINPAGEVLAETPAAPMTADERAAMLSRLETCIIAEIMEETRDAHITNCISQSGRIRRDYITRVSTNEFFFYTQEPLTLREFEALLNRISEKAKTMPAGIHFILGSFAVKTDDGKVMNVTPYITCGSKPNVLPLVKNVTSPIDIRYKIPDGAGGSDTLPELDLVNPTPLPKILINGADVAFTFENVLACKTPGELPFLTAIDICVDHSYALAKQRYELILKTNPRLSEQIITHVVISNSIPLHPESCLGSYIMHSDPYYTALIAANPATPPPRKLAFGNELCTTYEGTPVVLYGVNLNLENRYAYKTIDVARKREHQYEVSISDVKDTDLHAEKLFKSKYKDLRGDRLKTSILEDFRERIKGTTSWGELQTLKAELERSHEYTVLKTGQGWFTRTFGLKTSSVKAFEDMIQQQEEHLNPHLSL